ncbi:DUF6882 domain-containing protein [Nocardia blacklockiae]|uniref:DUF6882 domain-containing protein n=1 Tax=Nocardia blacklockiae TaxID=480036 RepID=UPI0018959FCC|nr:DUF6882 domain-containing protein [Nocardia blacklockiae]MBF6170526.1 hypothetical protein [Nocardia blacklockiae]
MLATPTLIDLLDDAALLSLEHQMHLTDLLGEHSWRCDLAGGRFEFVAAEATFACTEVHLLGTAAPEAESWLWSWANPLGFPEPVTAVAKAVRYFGVQHRINELASAELPFATVSGTRPEPAQVVGVLMEAAKIITGHWMGYTAVVGEAGARAAFLVEHPEFRLPQPEPARIAEILTRGATGVGLSDHRRAVRSYLRRRGLTATLDATRRHLTFTGPDIFGTVEFDADGRIGTVHAKRT